MEIVQKKRKGGSSRTGELIIRTEERLVVSFKRSLNASPSVAIVSTWCNQILHGYSTHKKTAAVAPTARDSTSEKSACKMGTPFSEDGMPEDCATNFALKS